MYENTLLVFSSDQGLAMGSHGLMGKQNLYDAGMKAPLFMAGPGVPQGETAALTYLLDIFPTVCDFVGAKIPTELDGKSLKRVIDGQSAGVRDSLFCAYRDVQRAVRDERYKLIRYPQVNVTQLFDLKTDPDEMHSLADDPAQAERIKGLTAKLMAWQKDLGDTTPLVVDRPADPKWDPAERPAPVEKGKKRKRP
jgi:arylsulfatase A-like enzyme